MALTMTLRRCVWRQVQSLQDSLQGKFLFGGVEREVWQGLSLIHLVWTILSALLMKFHADSETSRALLWRVLVLNVLP